MFPFFKCKLECMPACISCAGLGRNPRPPVPPRGTPPANQAAGCTEAYPWNGAGGAPMTGENPWWPESLGATAPGNRAAGWTEDTYSCMRALLANGHPRAIAGSPSSQRDVTGTTNSQVTAESCWGNGGGCAAGRRALLLLTSHGSHGSGSTESTTTARFISCMHHSIYCTCTCSHNLISLKQKMHAPNQFTIGNIDILFISRFSNTVVSTPYITNNLLIDLFKLV
ncbi:unnamed protein product [Urochloa humidicola]